MEPLLMAPIVGLLMLFIMCTNMAWMLSTINHLVEHHGVELPESE